MNIFTKMERKVEMNIIEKLIAGFIERSCKNYVTTIIGVLSVLVYAVNQFGSLVPSQYQAYVSAGSVVLAGVALILAKDSGQPTDSIPVVKKLGVILLALAIGSMMAPTIQAQTQPAVSNGFSGASEAVALHYNGEWSAATIATESYDFLDFGAKKTIHLYLEGKELIAPTPGFSVYAGGIKVEPDFSSLLAKTNVKAAAFVPFFTAAVGNGLPSAGGSHISLLAGGGVKYNLTSNLSWQTLEGQYGRFGSNSFAVVSTGLSFIFGGQK